MFTKNHISLAVYLLLVSSILSMYVVLSAQSNTTVYALGNSPGTLDIMFDDDGQVATDFNVSIDYGWAVALQEDGKIVVAGASINSNGTDFVLARYNKDGSLDTTFGIDGKVITDFGSEDDGGYDLAIQPDGKILVAGSIFTVTGDNFALARYNSNGTLDTTFDGDGKVTTDVGSWSDRCYGMAVQSDGKIILAGTTYNADQDFAIVRYNINGSLDTNFGTGGKVVTDFGNQDRGNSVVVQQADDKIIVAGDSNGSFALARYNNDGSLDIAFNNTGKVIATIAGGDFATDVALQPDGKIIAAGFGDNISTYRDFVLMRFNIDGSLDTTFDSDGKVATDFGSEDDGRAVVIQPNGKIVMVGSGNALSTFALVRYNNDGKLDTDFGTDGKVITPIGGSSVAYAVALQPDGNIIVAGSSYNGNNLDFALARYIGDSTSQIFYVKWNASGAGDGSSWADAYTDLQSALSAASAGDEIWVAAGTYKPTSGADRSVSFILKNGVAVYGGFAGTESLLAERDYQTNVTILSGDIGNSGDNSDNSYHVVVGSDTDNSAILDGFTVTGGNADGSTLELTKGGGMYNNLGSPTVRNSIFDDNSATFGAGMYNYGDQFIYQGKYFIPVITNVVFSNNTADEGGGMRNEHYSSPILTDVTFKNNSVVRGGGGLENFDYCNPILTNVVFHRNTAGVGGGMLNWNGDNPTLTNVTFSDNSAVWGAGMSNDQSNPILVNVVFDGNTTLSDPENPPSGGGMFNTASDPTLTNVTFSNNSADYGGGLFLQSGSSPSLVNVTFSGNSAVYGSGILSRDVDSSPTLTNVTLGNNIASDGGGTFANAGSPVIKNSILWGNTGGEIINVNVGVPVVNDSIVQGGYIGSGNLDANPLLGPLQDNGGFTQTMALLAGSSAIDAGDDANCPATDQRGVTRPQGSHCDIGAYEYEGSEISTRFPSADFNGDGKTDVAVFRPSNSTWYIQGVGPFVYGQAGDIPVPADYNGDGKDDIAVFRPSNSTWYIRGMGSFVYGAVGDIPVVADYNGDGKDDIAVFRPTNSTWYILGMGPFVYGTVGDIPVVADYNGDGKDDIAVFRPTNSTWYIYGVGPFVYGTVGDIPVVADYNGDGKADIAVFRPSNSTWYLYGVGPRVYGTVGDIPVIGDYNGDGKADIAVFRPTNSTWYIYGVGPSMFGIAGDIPV